MIKHFYIKQKWYQFLFPLYPVKVLKSVSLISLLGLLIALSIVLNFISIKIPAIGISISFGWLPTILVGWFFGPIIGLFIGALTDTLCFLIQGGVWFWLYAIQEPLVGFLSGLIFLIYKIFLDKKIKLNNIIIVNQIFIFCFFFLCIFFVFYYTNPNNPIFIKLVSKGELTYEVNTIFRYLILGFLILFLIILEFLIFYNFKKHIDSSKKIILMFTSIICIIITIIFSFILGVVSAIKYYEYLYNKTPPNLLNYGVVYYLLPRIIKECIKTPIYISLLTLIIYCINPLFIKIKQSAYNSYNY